MGLLFSKKFNPEDLPDLTGKVFVITGGAAGIGWAVVQALARRGAKIYIAARTEDRAEAAIARLKASGLGPGHGQLDWFELDLADPRIAKRSAEEFMRREERLDVLINCAAIMMVPYAKTHDGIQDVVMVNYIGHFVFTQTLLPLLKRTASEPNSDVRIINVSTDGYVAVRHPLQFKTIEDFNLEYKDVTFPWPSLQRYCYSKLLIMLEVFELQRLLDEEGVPIMVLSTHPGAVNTDGAKKWIATFGDTWLGGFVKVFINSFFTAPSSGATSTVFAAAAPEVRAEPRKYRAAYIIPPAKCTQPAPQARDPEAAKQLWELTERVLKDIRI